MSINENKALTPELVKQCREALKGVVSEHRERYPLMEREDVIKLVFQGMLGVGHLVASPDMALKRLQSEWNEATSIGDEALTEVISPQWFRLNLRAAKAKGISEGKVAQWFFESAKMEPLPFTRRDVYDLCAEIEESEEMKAAAGRILDENWLPSHSEEYRQAYRPAYRVLSAEFLEEIEE